MSNTCQYRLLLLFAYFLFACSSSTSSRESDARSVPDALPVADAGPTTDAIAPLGWVDFAVSGCASGDGTEASPCLGPSALALRFSVLAPTSIERYAWSFDKGIVSSNASPEHIFEAPGSYDISLDVEGPGGTAGITKLAAVVVIPAPLAAPCSDSSHCASGTCICNADADCGPQLQTGMCVLDCLDNAMCGGNVCVDLDATGVADAPWRRRTCLPPCTPDDDSTCTKDRTCQALLDVEGNWAHACLPPGLLLPLGATCRDANGDLEHSACASGACADVGLRGQCSFDCTTVPCPAQTACATDTVGTAAPRCLAACSSTLCETDPEASCQTPGEAFTIDGPGDPAGYCRPL